LGKFQAAIDAYDEIQKNDKNDWESYLHQATCHVYLKDYEKAKECANIANEIQPSDMGYLQLAKIFGITSDIDKALSSLQEGLDHSPDNPDIMTTMGLLFLRKGEADRAFSFLGSVLSQDSRNIKAILAAASIIQDHSDMDVALIKYRIAVHQNPNSAQVWNNIGMCFYGKKKLVGAISCLKRAVYLAPFEWIIYYNLGIAHLAAEM
jgi:Bardet-Biedl syndrome 4 protein